MHSYNGIDYKIFQLRTVQRAASSVFLSMCYKSDVWMAPREKKMRAQLARGRETNKQKDTKDFIFSWEKKWRKKQAVSWSSDTTRVVACTRTQKAGNISICGVREGRGNPRRETILPALGGRAALLLLCFFFFSFFFLLFYSLFLQFTSSFPPLLWTAAHVLKARKRAQPHGER